MLMVFVSAALELLLLTQIIWTFWRPESVDKSEKDLHCQVQYSECFRRDKLTF